MKPPRVTVLMAAFNAARFLRESVESILAQTFRDFELVIVDDGSTDDTAEIVRSFHDERIVLLRNERNLGLTASLNRGLRASRGEWIARQDADDISDPVRLAREADFFSNHPDTVLVGTHARLIDTEGRTLGGLRVPVDPLGIRWAQMFDNGFIHSAVMFSRAVALDGFGGYDESFRISQDYALWSRMMRRHPVANLDETLLSLRVHPSSLMRGSRAETDDESRRVIEENIRATVGDPGDMERALALIAQFRWRVQPESLEKFHALFAKLLARFEEAHPEAKTSTAFRRVIAEQFARIGYNLLPDHRAAAFAEFDRALREDARTFFRLPWPRILALTLLGAQARSIYMCFQNARVIPSAAKPAPAGFAESRNPASDAERNS